MYNSLPPVFIGPVMEHPELEGMFYTVVNSQAGINQRVETIYLFKGRSDALRFRMQFTRLVVNAQYNGHMTGRGHNTSIINLEKDQYNEPENTPQRSDLQNPEKTDNGGSSDPNDSRIPPDGGADGGQTTDPANP